MSRSVELACHSADRGLFDQAVALCSQVGPDRREYAACRSITASVYRQVGRHDLAEPFDRQGSAAIDGDPLGRTMCRLGLAADRVGVADLSGAQEALAAAEESLAALQPPHRNARWLDPWLTRAWIGAEVCLLGADPGGAVALLEPFAQRRPRRPASARWPFEHAKTMLFLGVAQRCAGAVDAAAASLATAARLAHREGLAALLVPAADQLHQLPSDDARLYDGAVLRARAVLAAHQPPGL